MATIGHPDCFACKKTPYCRITPCFHQACYNHYIKAESENVLCGHCGNPAFTVTELKQPTPYIDRVLPDGKSWSVHGFHPSAQKTSAVLTEMYSNGAGNNGSGQPPNGNFGNNIPTPGQDANNYIVGIAQNPRYVPPMLRGMPTPEDRPVRPESSISNHTFVTQPPQAPVNHVAANRGPVPRNMNGYTSGNYSYGPSQLEQQFASLDPFVGAPRPPSQQPSFFGSSSNSTTRPTYNNGAAAYPPPSLNNGRGYTQGGTSMYPGSNMNANSLGMNLAPANIPTPSVQSLAQDSAAANAFGNNMSRAGNFASIIRAGNTDNPMDPNFGNPGRDRRLPEESVHLLPQFPAPKGKVAAKQTEINFSDADLNTKGNAAAFLGVHNIPLPSWFNQVPRGYTPTLEEVFAALPMIEPCRSAMPPTAGVLKMGNIPYASSRSEIVAFFGRNAQILSQPEGSPYHAVHIMMDRSTGKTQDAFVELKNPKEASWVFAQFEKRIKSGRHAKIGDRQIVLTIVSQAEFIAELFPCAKNVEWDGGVPIIDGKRDFYYKEVQAAGFQGFLRDEELTSMTKFAETPQRSPFAQRSLVRSYEHLVTILHKYPWYAVNHVRIAERHAIYDTTIKTIRALMGLLRKTQNNAEGDVTKPTTSVLQELSIAALICPGFSEGQKAAIILNLQQGGYANFATARGMNFRFGGNSKFSIEWPFHGLVKQPGASDDLVEYVASLICEATMAGENLSLADIRSMSAASNKPPIFGFVNINYGQMDTLADLGRIELKVIEELLSRVLQRAAATGTGNVVARAASSHHS